MSETAGQKPTEFDPIIEALGEAYELGYIDGETAVACSYENKNWYTDLQKIKERYFF